MIFAAAVFSVFPSALIPEFWLRQWPFLEIESLRPIDRITFLAELGAAIAIDIVQCWSIIAIVVMALAVINSEAKFGVLILVGSAAVTIFNYGCSLWLMRYRSSGITVIGSCSVVFLIMLSDPVALFWGFDVSAHYGLRFAAAAVLACLGVLITRDAFRRWLVTELG